MYKKGQSIIIEEEPFLILSVEDLENKQLVDIEDIGERTSSWLDENTEMREAPIVEKHEALTDTEYENILKGVMVDAGGEGNEEFTYDMAQNLFFNSEIIEKVIQNNLEDFPSTNYLKIDGLEDGLKYYRDNFENEITQLIQIDLENYL